MYNRRPFLGAVNLMALFSSAFANARLAAQDRDLRDVSGIGSKRCPYHRNGIPHNGIAKGEREVRNRLLSLMPRGMASDLCRYWAADSAASKGLGGVNYAVVATDKQLQALAVFNDMKQVNL